ncbi:MAG: DUF983 domain-containing protein [Actinomycetota bacterium]
MTKSCPVCGSRGLFRSWFELKSHCPGCAHQFSQEEGFYIGAFALNIVIAEGLLLLCIGTYIVISAGNPSVDLPVGPFALAAVLAAVAGPIIFYPFSRTLWIAIDLIVRRSRNLS